METFRLLIFNSSTLLGVFCAFIFFMIICGILEKSKAGLVYMEFPFSLIYGTFLIIMIFNSVTESKHAYSEDFVNEVSLKAWRNKNPDEYKLYNILLTRLKSDNCLLCNSPATFGIVSYQNRLNPPENLGKGKVLVCPDHTIFLQSWLKDKISALNVFKINYFENNYYEKDSRKMKYEHGINKINNDRLFKLLETVIDGSVFPYDYFIDVKLKSKEDILSNCGFYIGILLGALIAFFAKLEDFYIQYKYVKDMYL